MRIHNIFLISCLLGTAPCYSQTPQAATAVQFRNEETIVFLGDGYLEGEGTTGHLEGYLTVAHRDKKLKFRNLSWSGDTPRGESRSYFGPPEEGYQRLKQNLAEINPTLVFINFGAGAAGDAALSPEIYAQGLERLVNSLKNMPSKPNLVFVSPIPRQEIGRAKEAIIELNKKIDEFGELTKEVAKKHGSVYIDIRKETQQLRSSTRADLTVNGAVLTTEGQALVSPIVATAILGEKPKTAANPKLLEAILKKNELFFNRWRPANEIYLFGSRKHEQGNNAIEIPQFDPLINTAEEEIAKAKVAAIP